MTAQVTPLRPKRVASVASVAAKRQSRSVRTADLKLATDVRNAYTRWVVFHSALYNVQADMLTLFTFHTWVWDIADFTPYIQVSAPTSEAGKSRVFDVAKKMVREAFVVVDPTPAALFSAIDLYRPTLLIDEADMLRESRQLRAVLNSGFQPGTPIVRAKKSYDCFVPKMFSGIAGEKPPLTEATLSRCIQLNIRRKTEKEKVERFIPRLAAQSLVPIQGRLAKWALKARDELALMVPDNLPDELTDRQRDMWGPLVAIADYLGGTWPKRIREAAVALSKAVPKSPDPAVQILADIHVILDSYSGNRITTKKLAELRERLEVKNYEDSLSPHQIAARLGGFGLYRDPTSFRDGHGRDAPVVRGYTFRRAGKYLPAWQDAFDRYRA